VQVETYPPYAR